MNSLIVSLLIVLILMLSILIGIAIFLVYKLILKQENKEQSSPPKFRATSNSESNSRGNVSNQYKISERSSCPFHSENSPVGTCLICEEAFCEECLIEHESLYFCKEHFRTYADYQWEKITDILTTPDTPEASMHVHNFKRDLWKYEKIPTFVLTHYKINVNDDHIESYVQLHVRVEDKDSLEKRLEKVEKK